MKTYNIYYKYNKINKYPLLKSDIDKIVENKYIIYQNNKVQIKDVKIIECTLI